jgi:hypothetical protein
VKTIRNTVTSLVMILLSSPLVYGQDLSNYQGFSLGTSLARVSKQIGLDSSGPSLIHQRPAVIQELTSWSVSSSRSSEQVDQLSEILFRFYNGELYRIVVTYDQHATAGLTAEDMVQAVSALYGTATRPATDINFPTKAPYDSKEKIIARWEDSQNSIDLFRSSFLHSFAVVMFSKRLDAQAEAAIAQSLKLEWQEDPQKEIERQIRQGRQPISGATDKREGFSSLVSV